MAVQVYHFNYQLSETKFRLSPFVQKMPEIKFGHHFYYKKQLLPLLSPSKLFLQQFISEKKMFLDKKVKGIGIWFPSENR